MIEEKYIFTVLGRKEAMVHSFSDRHKDTLSPSLEIFKTLLDEVLCSLL